MSPNRTFVLATLLVVVLGGSLALRLVNGSSAFADERDSSVVTEPLRWTGGAPVAGLVPPRLAVTTENLGAFPNWWRPSYYPAIAFQTDLDLIAPLGDGPENSALWFADFAARSGARWQEYSEAKAKAGSPATSPPILPDDPLLLEAEPWVDQATMQFYPEVWEFDAWQTQIPNLLMMLDLAKSWTARGDAAQDADAALADYRRAVRLGRLLRHEDGTMIADLVGLECIRIGLDGMYRRLTAEGDSEQALVVSLALGEVAPQRLQTSERITRVEISRFIRKGWFGRVEVEIPDDDLDLLCATARNDPQSRFRIEAMLSLNAVRFRGTAEQRERAGEVLAEIAQDDDPWIADAAEWARTTQPDWSAFGVE